MATQTVRVAVPPFKVARALISLAGFGFSAYLTRITGQRDLHEEIERAADVIVSDWLWVSRERGLGAKLTFYPYSSALGAVMVPNSSTIRTLADLKGRKLAVAGGLPQADPLLDGVQVVVFAVPSGGMAEVACDFETRILTSHDGYFFHRTSRSSVLQRKLAAHKCQSIFFA